MMTLELSDTGADNIEPCLIDLRHARLRSKKHWRLRSTSSDAVMKDYQEWLTIVKDRAFRAGVPLRAELLAMIHKSAEELGREAEAESLGFNARRVHPDVYMNELMRHESTIKSCPR